MSLLIPSKVQGTGTKVSTGTKSTAAGSTASAATSGGATDPNAASSAAAAGGTSAGGSTGGGAVAPGSPCADRPDQVTGDPYSPPCIAFSGDNGGATSTGVTSDTIKVAFRILDEKGFQQTLASLAGANLVDTPETVQNTVSALAEYFNQHFQLYGRKISIDFYKGVGSTTNELLGQGVDKAEADADTVQSMGDFADL